jgi:hypothetical protein
VLQRQLQLLLLHQAQLQLVVRVEPVLPHMPEDWLVRTVPRDLLQAHHQLCMQVVRLPQRVLLEKMEQLEVLVVALRLRLQVQEVLEELLETEVLEVRDMLVDLWD